MIFFVSRKYTDYTFNSSFFVEDGSDYPDLADYLVGDTVDIIFPISETQFRAITESGLPIHAYSDMTRPAYSVHIQFKVVKRKHTLSFKKMGTLSLLGNQIHLMALSGYWEDVFKWICLGEIPIWASEYISPESDD